MKTGAEAVIALRAWMLDLHRMGRIFTEETRRAAETEALRAALEGASFQQAFHAGISAANGS